GVDGVGRGVGGIFLGTDRVALGTDGVALGTDRVALSVDGGVLSVDGVVFGFDELAGLTFQPQRGSESDQYGCEQTEPGESGQPLLGRDAEEIDDACGS